MGRGGEGYGVLGMGYAGDKIPIWDKNPIAVVGTRKITSYGRMVTQKITRELVLEGVTIVSGFMYGVDVCAQQTALHAGGRTVGVLGYGFDHISPCNHEKTMLEMLSQGAVFITEYPPWVSGSPGTYPQRNRIVAGMSLGVVVTEAAKRSGSHITARMAFENGREVFAVPGSITSPYSVGTKELIKEGATMVGSGREIMEEIGLGYGGRSMGYGVLGMEYGGKSMGYGVLGIDNKKRLSLEEKVLNLLKITSMTSDELARELSLGIAEIVSILGLMEIKGIISQEGGVYYF